MPHEVRGWGIQDGPYGAKGTAPPIPSQCAGHSTCGTMPPLRHPQMANWHLLPKRHPMNRTLPAKMFDLKESNQTFRFNSAYRNTKSESYHILKEHGSCYHRETDDRRVKPYKENNREVQSVEIPHKNLSGLLNKSMS